MCVWLCYSFALILTSFPPPPPHNKITKQTCFRFEYERER